MVHPELAQLAAARQILEPSRDLGQISHIHDTALAARRYAEAKKLGAEMTGYAQEIVNRAERRIGQLLAGALKDPGGRPSLKTGAAPEPVSTPHKQAGKKLSARSQRLALLDEATFEANVRKPTARIERIARDQLAEARRREYAQAANEVAPITGWERTEHVRTLAEQLRGIAETLHGPQLLRDATGFAGACSWYRGCGWELIDRRTDRYEWGHDLEDGAAEAVATATAEARAELDKAVSSYQSDLAAAVERARQAADRIAATLRREASRSPAMVLYTSHGWRGVSEDRQAPGLSAVATARERVGGEP